MTSPTRERTRNVNASRPTVAETPIPQVKGAADWLPDDCRRIARLEALLLDRFARAGFELLRTPVLEQTELHERKSGAGIVAKLFEVPGAGRACLRPELTAGIVRAYTAAEPAPATPWRVSHAGPVFRHEEPRPDRLREFHQVGVELLGASGAQADGEVIWLAAWALAEAGITGATIRIGHVGLILEILERSGLPTTTQSSLIELLSEAATEGQDVQAIEVGLKRLEEWLHVTQQGDVVPMAVEKADDAGVDRLFRTLVPVVVGRRSGHEIIQRLRRKWDLGHGLLGTLREVARQVHDVAQLKGRPEVILDRLKGRFEALAPESVAALRDLVATLADYGVDLDQVELDLGFGRGIGFYSQMIFELLVDTPEGQVEVCGGGRYDGLARVLGSDRDDRGVGFAFGLERLDSLIRARSTQADAEPRHGILVVPTNPSHRADAVRVATYLRSKGATTLLDTEQGLSDAIASARAQNLAVIVSVEGALEAPGALARHDLDTAATRSEILPGDLAWLAREQSKGVTR